MEVSLPTKQANLKLTLHNLFQNITFNTFLKLFQLLREDSSWRCSVVRNVYFLSTQLDDSDALQHESTTGNQMIGPRLHERSNWVSSLPQDPMTDHSETANKSWGGVHTRKRQTLRGTDLLLLLSRIILLILHSLWKRPMWPRGAAEASMPWSQ